MAFKQVFYALREVFPQVDLRILKAVASQYSSDVDAAVEFVLSDVLPAVTEPAETHYKLQDIDYAEHDHTDIAEKPKLYSGSILLADQGVREDANVLFSPSAGSRGTSGESNPSVYEGLLCSNDKMEEYSNVEDKVVINETTVVNSLQQDHYARVRSLSTSVTEPHIIEYEQSAFGACVGHRAPEEDKVTPKAEHIGNHEHVNSNYELSDLFASSGNMLSLFMQSPANCAVYEGKMPLKLSKAKSKHDFSKSEDNCYLGTLLINFSSNKDRETSKTLPDAPTVHTISKSEDNYDLQLLFEKNVSPKLSKAEGIHDFSKPEDNHNLENLFLNFCSTEDGYTSKDLPSTPTVHAHFKAEVNAGKDLDVLLTAENPPELNKSANDSSFYNFFGEPCTADSTTQIPCNFHGNDKNEQSVYKLENQHNLFDVFALSKANNSSLHISEEKDDSHIADNEEQPSNDFKNSGNFTSICNLNGDLNLSELFSSTQNAVLSDLDSKCEVTDETEREFMCSNTLEKCFVCPIVDLDSFLSNGKMIMPGEHKSEEFLDISTQSYHTTEINKYISDFTKSKEALSSLFESTTMKMKEMELQEENSRQAKQDAVKAHQDFLVMAEHFNKLIKNSKESNDKLAQVVCEEKSSLAALAQDLQSRLTKLSAQRDEALRAVQEIKFELDARLVTSVEEEIAAREQIIQDEKLALLVRKEKESTMESIMEGSRKLQKEAEENILLRGFLLDRGRLIDILQGEISSIHANVAALKETTLRGKLKSALVTTSYSTSHMDNCKSASTDKDECSGNENRNGLPLEMVGSRDKDPAAFSDDEWEVLETNQA